MQQKGSYLPFLSGLEVAISADESALELDLHFLHSPRNSFEIDDDELRRSLIGIPASLFVAVEQVFLAELLRVPVQNGRHFAGECVASGRSQKRILRHGL